MLVKTMDNFVEYSGLCKDRYIYIEAGYMAEEGATDTLTCGPGGIGILTPVCYENGNVLARVDVHGEKTEESEEKLVEFKQNRAVTGTVTIIADRQLVGKGKHETFIISSSIGI